MTQQFEDDEENCLPRDCPSVETEVMRKKSGIMDVISRIEL